MSSVIIEGPFRETPDEALAAMLRATEKAPHDYVMPEKTADEWIAEADDPLGTIN